MLKIPTWFLVLLVVGSSASAQRPAPTPTDHFDLAPGQEVVSIVFSRDGCVVATGDRVGNIILTDVETGKTMRTFEVKGKGAVSSLAFAPDGKELAACVGSTLSRWKLPTGEPLPSPPMSKNYPVRHLQFTPDGRRLVGIVGGVFPTIWNLAEQKEHVGKRLAFQNYSAADLRVAADGKSALTIPTFGVYVVKLDLDDGKELSRTLGLGGVHGHALSADGEYALLSKNTTAGQVLLVWDLAKNHEYELPLGLEGLTQACFSDDGKLIAAGFTDGTVRIWHRALRKQIASFKANAELVHALALPAGGQALATASVKRGDASLWSLPRLLDKQTAKKTSGPIAKNDKKAPAPTDLAQIELAGKAHKIFKTYCYRCHGQDGAAEGGLNYLLDHDRLVGGRQIVAGSVAKSRLLKRVLMGEMPPEEEKIRPTTEEMAILRKWVESGAAAWPKRAEPRPFVTLAEVERLAREDHLKIPAADRRFLAYFTLAPLANARQSEDELQTVRLALSRLLNSVSTEPQVVPPQPVDAAKLLLRADLRDYGQWVVLAWRSTLRYPYGMWARGGAGPQGPMPLRADWFVHAASRPPLYHGLLNIPWTAKELENQLKVKAADNIKDFKVLRAGFNGSGISRSNRIIERHESAFGYYWKSYDFAASDGRKNIFAYPLGPAPSPQSFHSDGGEMIFQLPNGLQGYMLTDGRGNRLDKGPTSIVSDPKHPERVVENGISCMSCHSGGLIDKGDQIRAHAEKNFAAFNEQDRQKILALYSPRDKFAAALAIDTVAYQAAAKKAGGKAGGAEPIVVTALRYEAELDLRQVAAEAWLSTEELLERLDDFPSLAPTLGVLRTPGGTIGRKVFQRDFPLIVENLKVGDYVSPPGNAAAESPTPREVNAHSGDGLVLKDYQLVKHQRAPSAWTPTLIDPTFRWIAAIEDPNTIRLFDAQTGKPAGTVLRYPHTISTMAFAHDGSLIAVGGHNGRPFIWETASGKRKAETPLLKAQPTVWALAFSPDGKCLAGTGGEHCHAQLWNAQTGQQQQSFLANHSTVERLVFSPDGRNLLIGGTAHVRPSIYVWDLVAGKKQGALTGHPRKILALAVSPDGGRAVTGGADGEIRFWDLKTCEQVGAEKLMTGKNPHGVQAIAFSKDGKLLATTHEHSVTLWEADSFRPLLTFKANTASELRGIAFSPDGCQLTATTQMATIRFWEVRTLLKSVEQPMP